MNLELLLGTHRAGDSAEATLALLAVAAINGIRADGSLMLSKRPACDISISRIAAETGMSRRAAARGLDAQAKSGAIQASANLNGTLHYEVNREALALRNQDYQRRIRLPAAVRRRRLRPNAMLLVGLVLAQRPRDGRPLRLGRGYLSERLGLTLRQVDRAIAAAKEAGVLQTWTQRNVLHLHVATVGEADVPTRSRPETGASMSQTGNPPCAKAAIHPVRRRQSTCAKAANAIRSTGEHPDQHPDAASPRVESISRSEGAQQQLHPPAIRTVCQIVEPWVVSMHDEGITTLAPDNDDHRSRVAGLIARLPGCDPPDFGTDLNRRRGYYSEQVRFAARLCGWAGTPEELARWLVRVAARRKVVNLAAYLRVAAQRGDPSTLLRSAKKNEAGRAAETWRDFTPATEKALEGEYVAEVQQLVTAGSEVLSTTHPARRKELLGELREMLERGRRAAARALLMQVVGKKPTDAELAASVGEVLSIEEARRLLVA